MKKKSEEKQIDYKDWEEFLNNPVDIIDKDKINGKSREQLGRYKFDFHGYSIDNANKKVEELILRCSSDGFKEILIITGKGVHSNNEDNIYISKEYNKLHNTLPEYINNKPELYSKILKIKEAPKELGGTGALIVKLKKL